MISNLIKIVKNDNEALDLIKRRIKYFDFKDYEKIKEELNNLYDDDKITYKVVKIKKSALSYAANFLMVPSFIRNDVAVHGEKMFALYQYIIKSIPYRQNFYQEQLNEHNSVRV